MKPQATAEAQRPAASGTQKPDEAPWLSMTQPANAAPGATPTDMPVVVQAMPSVSRDGATCCSIRFIATINVGEIMKPVLNWHRAKTSGVDRGDKMRV